MIFMARVVSHEKIMVIYMYSVSLGVQVFIKNAEAEHGGSSKRLITTIMYENVSCDYHVTIM